MLTCRELTAQADELLAGELSWRRRLAVRLHLALCHHCRRYVEQYRRMLHALPASVDEASDEEVALVMETIERAVKPHGDE